MTRSIREKTAIGRDWFKSLSDDEKIDVAEKLIRECLLSEVIWWWGGDEDNKPCLCWEATGEPLNE